MSNPEKKHLLSLSVFTVLISGYASQSLAVETHITLPDSTSLHQLTTLSAAPKGPPKLTSATAANTTDHTHYDMGDQHVHHDHEIQPQPQLSISSAQSDSFDT